MKTTILIPTLNEIEGMRIIMPRIKREWYDQLIIIDGGSSDGTVEYARDNNYFLVVQKEKGMRNAYRDALEYVAGDIVITLSPDGNCIPETIPLLINKMDEGYDMVIVSRYLQNAKSEDDDMITSFGNWFFTSLVNLLYRSNYTDVMGIYRAYRKDVIYKLALNKDGAYVVPERLFRTNLSWEPLLSVLAAKNGLKVAEIPGDEPKRIGGERKLQVFQWGAGYLFQILTERIK